jgi:hypothetical protein
VWRIERCGDDVRLTKEFINDFAVFDKCHVSATWAFPNNLFVLCKDGEIFKVRPV